jgi:tetratricopeptide (TPR) repeat protein
MAFSLIKEGTPVLNNWKSGEWHVISTWPMFQRVAFLLTLILACDAFASAGAGADPNELYQRSTDALYNLDFNTAEQGYEILTRDYPESPDYWNALASAIFLRITFEQQKLNLESFSGGTTFGSRDSTDEVNPEDEKRLRATVGTAIAKADALLKKNPRDVHAMYQKGNAEVTLASFEGTVKRSVVGALSNARAAKSIHLQVLKLDPDFDDARASIGTYDYVVAVLPAVVRLGASLFGLGTEGKDTGIRQLEAAAAKGKNASTDAKILLAVVYSREKRYADALRVMTDLHSAYPRNFVFQFAEAATSGRLKRYDDARRIYSEILANVQSKTDGYDRVRLEKVYYLLGIDDIHTEQFDKAVEDFSHVTAGTRATPDEKAGAHLWVGKIFDSMKNRSNALEQYTAAALLNCNADLKAEARKYIRRPYAYGE